MEFVMELHRCGGLRGRREGAEGFVYHMITYITWLYTISATGLWDVGLQKLGKGGESHKYDSHTSCLLNTMTHY